MVKKRLFTYTKVPNTQTEKWFTRFKSVEKNNLTPVKFPLHQNVQWARPHQGQRRFLNNLGLKQLHTTSINSLLIQPWKQVAALIYNPQRGLPHPLAPSLLNTHPHKWCEGVSVYVCVGGSCCWGMWLTFLLFLSINQPDCNHKPA